MGPEVLAGVVYPILHKLNGNKIIKVKEKYPALKTRKRSADKWWNSLTYFQKIEVASAGMHYHKINANYKWWCYENNKFNDLPKHQQKIVKFVYEKRNENWFMYDIRSMLKI